MSRCINCNIEILDEADYCPLCHTVLEPIDELENMYPDVRYRRKRILYYLRIYLYFAMIVEAVLIGINYLTNTRIWWCVFSGIGLLMIYLFLRYAILGKSNYKVKIFNFAVMGALITIAVDFVIGFQGWSLDYALPAIILLVDLSIILGMILNRRSWYSYIIWEISTILCSLIPIMLYLFGLEKNPYIVFLPFVVSVLLFVGTMIIGDRVAWMELKRRFHY